MKMNRSKLFAVIFILSAFAITYWMMQRIPHPVTLHINDRWHIMLIGEDQASAVHFYSSQFEITKQDRANLWLRGKGKLRWHDHTITVYKASVRLDSHSVSTNMRELGVNIMFYPDGRVTKGKPVLKY